MLSSICPAKAGDAYPLLQGTSTGKLGLANCSLTAVLPAYPGCPGLALLLWGKPCPLGRDSLSTQTLWL